MAALGPARRAKPCPLCGEMFFPASLPFHMKACEKKQATQFVRCPFCSKDYRRLELANHTMRCKMRPKSAAAPRGMTEDSARAAARAAAGASAAAVSGQISASVGYGAPGAGSAAMPGDTGLPPEGGVDARVPCSSCGRRFAPERIGVHEKACSKLTSGAKRRGMWKGTRPGAPGAAGVRRDTGDGAGAGGGTGYTGAGAGGDDDGTFGTPPPLPGQRPRTSAGPQADRRLAAARSAIKTGPKRRPIGSAAGGNTAGGSASGSAGGGGEVPAWKRKHDELQKAMRLARKVAKHTAEGTLDELGPIEASPDQHVGLIPCPHCGRTFSDTAAARHIPRCATTINRPRPPPTVAGEIRGRGLGGGGAGLAKMRAAEAEAEAAAADEARRRARPMTSAGHEGRRGRGPSGGGSRASGRAPSAGRQRDSARGRADPRSADADELDALPRIGHPGAGVTPPRGRSAMGQAGPEPSPIDSRATGSGRASGIRRPGPAMARTLTARRGRAEQDDVVQGDVDDLDDELAVAAGGGSAFLAALRRADRAMDAAVAAMGGSGSASVKGREALSDAHRLLRIAMRDAGAGGSGQDPGSARGSAGGGAGYMSGVTSGTSSGGSTPAFGGDASGGGGGGGGFGSGGGGVPPSVLRRPSGQPGVSGGFSGTPHRRLGRPGTSGSTRLGGLAAGAGSFGGQSARFSAGFGSARSGGGGGGPDGIGGMGGPGAANATSALSPLATSHQQRFAADVR